MAYTKRTSPVSREDFRAHAEPLAVTVAGVDLQVPPKDYSSGSFGWHLAGKLAITVAGVEVPVQMGLVFTVIGSKND